MNQKYRRKKARKQEVNKIIQTMSACFGGLLGFLFGKADGMLYALLAFVICDYISGVLVAIIQRKLSSAVGFNGIFKKICIFFLVAISNIIDTQVIGNGSVFRMATICFYIANEGISIIENSAALGLPVPKKIINVLIQLKSENEKED